LAQSIQKRVRGQGKKLARTTSSGMRLRSAPKDENEEKEVGGKGNKLKQLKVHRRRVKKKQKVKCGQENSSLWPVHLREDTLVPIWDNPPLVNKLMSSLQQ
jgi:hypothetical protein